MTKYDLIELIAKRLAMVDGINLEAADPAYDIALANFGLNEPVEAPGRKPTADEIRHYYMAAMVTVTTYVA